MIRKTCKKWNKYDKKDNLIFFSEVYKRKISIWKTADKTFLETHNFPAILEKVNKNTFVTFVGVPGSGKSATAHHIALKLKEKGYEILPIVDISLLETYCDPCNPQVFVIDDVLGNFGFDKAEFQKTQRYADFFSNPSMSETKILTTCRETVFKNNMLKGTFFTNKENVVQLHGTENALTDQDKYDLLAQYNIDKELLPLDKVCHTSRMFPLLCALFTKEKDLLIYGSEFFILPLPCILGLLNDMKTKNTIQYAALVLLMVNQNQWSEEDLEDEHAEQKKFNEMKTKVLKKLKINRSTDIVDFTTALTEMDGTYTRECCGLITFLNDTMYEIIAYHFGRELPEVTLQCMSSDYVANYIKIGLDKKTQSNNECEDGENKTNVDSGSINVNDYQKHEIDLCIQLQESSYEMFAERLYNDLENGEFYNVFANKALRHSSFAKYFAKRIEKKSYTELYSVFLSDITDTSKIEKMSTIRFLRNKIISPSHQYRMIKNVFCNAKGIYVVILFGLHQILQTLIEQIIKNNRNLYSLFGNNWIGYANETKAIRKKLTEHCRLLCIGCFSGDLITVQILLKHIDKQAINSNENEILNLSWTNISLKNVPLVIASKLGHISIVSELLKMGADVNKDDGCNTPLTAACKSGCLSIARELINNGADVNLHCNSFTPLAAACENGDINVVEELLKVGADVNHHINCAPIIAASKHGRFDIVFLLLKRGANVNQINNYDSPIIIACKSGPLSVVHELIKAGADVNDKNIFFTPLTAACERSKKSIIKALIKAGAHINSVSQNISPPLTMLCKGGKVSIVKLFLNAGADVNLSSECCSPLHEACIYGKLSVVKMLIKAGATINLSVREGTPLTVASRYGQIDIVKYLIRKGADVNSKTEIDAPLRAACVKNHGPIVKELIKAGANVNLSFESDTALKIALDYRYMGIVKELIKVGPDSDFFCNLTTLLITACKEGKLKYVQILLELGSNVNQSDSENNTPLATALDHGHNSIVDELLKAGANIFLSDKVKHSLPTVCEEGYLNTVKAFIRAGTNVNQSYGKQTPLTAAIKGGHVCVVRELISAGSIVNQNDGFLTPLTAACSQETINVIKELTKAGADVNQSDGQNTPLTVACIKGNLSVIEVLLKEGADINLKDTVHSPVLAAYKNNHLDVMIALINAEAVIDFSKANLNQLLEKICHYALKRFPTEYKLFFVIKKLIQAGADLRNIHKKQNFFINACYSGSLSIVKELIKAGAHVNESDQTNTPLTASCFQGHLSIVEELIKEGADINLRDAELTPLIAAFHGGRLEIAEKLIREDSIVIYKQEADYILLTACYWGSLVVVKELINAGFIINFSSANHTPLTAACAFGHIQVVEELIKAGADVHLSNDCGETPLSLALDMGHLDIVRVLIKAGADDNVCNEMITRLHKLREKRDLENAGHRTKEWETRDPFSKPIGVRCAKYKTNGRPYY